MKSSIIKTAFAILFAFFISANLFALADKNEMNSQFILKDSLLVADEIYSYWDSTSWRETTKISYAYNEQGTKKEHLWQYWEKGFLKQFKRINFSFNDANLLRTESFQVWQNDRWENLSRNEYQYDSKNNLVLKENLNWIFDSQSSLYYWWSSLRTEYFYNPQNLLVETVIYERPNEDFKVSTRILNEYDSKGNLSQEIYQSFRDSDWHDDTKFLYNYNSHGKIIEFSTLYLKDTLWIEISKDSTVYDSEQRIIEFYQWENKNQQVTRNKEVRTYDTLKLTSEIINFTFKDSLWVKTKKTDKQYNPNSPNLMVGSFGYNWSDTGWVNQSKVVIDYWKVRTDIQETQISNEFSISPNPATDFIEISVGSRHALTNTDIRIFNVFGETVKNPTQTLPEGEGLRINVSGLPSGVYFVRINNTVNKFIKD